MGFPFLNFYLLRFWVLWRRYTKFDQIKWFKLNLTVEVKPAINTIVPWMLINKSLRKITKSNGLWTTRAGKKRPYITYRYIYIDIFLNIYRIYLSNSHFCQATGIQIDSKPGIDSMRSTCQPWQWRFHADRSISMHRVFTYICLIFMVNVGKYTIHGPYGHYTNPNKCTSYRGESLKTTIYDGFIPPELVI